MPTFQCTAGLLLKLSNVQAAYLYAAATVESQDSRLKLRFSVPVSLKSNTIWETSSLPLCQHIRALICIQLVPQVPLKLQSRKCQGTFCGNHIATQLYRCIIWVYCVEIYPLLIRKIIMSIWQQKRSLKWDILSVCSKEHVFPFHFHLSPYERNISEPSSSIIPFHVLSEEAPKSTHDSVEHVDSGIPHFPYQKSFFFLATVPSNSGLPALCQNTLASISGFRKKIKPPVFLLTLFLQLKPILEKKENLLGWQSKITDQLPQRQIVQSQA